METLECIPCNYETTRAYDMKKHEDSKKHAKKMHLYLLKYPNKPVMTTHKISERMSILPIASIDENFQNFASNDASKISKSEQDTVKNIKYCVEIEQKPKKKCNTICGCGKAFSHTSSLARHKHTCDQIDYKSEINDLKKQLITLQETIAKPQQITTASNNTSQIDNSFNTNNITDNSIKSVTNNTKTLNVVTYLNSNYNDAQPIKMLESNDVTKLLSYVELGKHTLEDHIIFYYRTCMLDQFLGELILKEFKKSDPKKQQIWISDIPRLSFLVRSAISKNESMWHPDKKGITLTKNIISPVSDEIFTLMKAYSHTCKITINDAQFEYQKEEIYKKSETAIEIIKEINLKTLHHKILLFIAPYFQLELDKAII